MRTLLMTALCSVELLAAGQQMNVAICNQGDVRESVIAAAKAETELVYRWAGVTILWRDCDALFSAELERNPWFIIRLRTEKLPLTVGPASLDVMGNAFVEKDGGCMADAYFQAIHATSEKYHGDSDALLGMVMAHELGHLLLGAGHTPDGVMQGVWNRRQMDALRHRWLRFSEESAARLRRALEARTAASDAGGKYAVVIAQAEKP